MPAGNVAVTRFQVDSHHRLAIYGQHPPVGHIGHQIMGAGQIVSGPLPILSAPLP